ncbi:DEKNAAC105427 [Brettanomyces naardenensis]|uniref:DEKNAAC105427 n=1 Tax=Brettanomyces naardenensis TaxID=13370 RepID=A0A448YTF4_BRENA|nr:DEKNAAC105427 [Brettanomyces naardenensis]
MSAEQYKAEGNDAFRAKDFPKAIELFSKAIDVSETPNHVLYSNRSACYASLHEYADALKDAEECVKINPTWAKGYNRVGAAYLGENKTTEAREAYEKALELDPSNKMAQSGLDDILRRSSRPAPDMGLGKMFSDPLLIDKLKANPKTAEFMKDPLLVEKVKQLQKSPTSMTQDLFSDPRLMTVIATILGVDLSAGPRDEAEAAKEEPKEEPKKETEEETQQPAKESAAESTEEPAGEPPVSSDKQQADQFKANGNALYKEHKFDEAIEEYEKAWNTYQDVTYLNNRAAAEFEKGDYDGAIVTCEKAVEVGRSVHADYTVIAKSFARIGNCYAKKDDLPKAIEFYEKSLTEHRTAPVLSKLRAAQRELKTREADAYMDKDKAEEARVAGNAEFKKADWPAAVKQYSEMIKRDPSDARGYSNRAAALMKLMSFPDAIRDCQEAIKRDPKFIRAYLRKANAEMAMKQYKDVDDTLQKAREIEQKSGQANGAQMREIEQLLEKALTQRFAPQEGETYEQTMKRVQQDPEVLEIMGDPVMQTILQQAQNNPAALQEHMKNPEVYRKVMILMAAGIIRTR